MSHAIHINLLGPVRIDAGRAQPPTDRAHALVELAAWMALHPDGAYGCQIDRDLVWSTSSRLSALSRLRRWLGPDALPHARSGHPYQLNAVTDWTRAAGPIVDRRGQIRADTPSGSLLGALRLVRGVPLADIAAPWADAPRLAMVLLLREAAAQLLARSDLSNEQRLEVRALSARLMPSDRIDSAGNAA
jgi:hypothetical protein